MPTFKRLIDIVTGGSKRPLRRLAAYYAVLLVVLSALILAYPATNAILMGGDAPSAGLAPQLLQDGLNAPPVADLLLGPGSLGEMVISTSLILLGIVALMLPVTWVYMSARSAPGHSQDVAQTLVILPIVVAGIVFIVQNSLALAFSLAGVVAAVRFRTKLESTRDVVFIFLAIGVGFAGGVQMLALGAIFSIAFNFIVLLAWRYDFGRSALLPTAASQWSEPLASLAAGNGNGNGIPDRDLVLALTQKNVNALAQRFDRVRGVLGPSRKKPRYNAVLSITSDKVAEAQVLMQKVLEKLTKRWVLDEVITHTGKPSEVYYLVRVGKAVTRDELITAIRTRAGDRVAAVDLELGEALTKKKAATS
ncbi:MAG TPA: DUF4956 domain-containing protein [Gemmatimonadaceae bacterium]|nr:DUF4956 domain-containing protein [Gemmatimonadaceae bacterium]